MGGTASTSDSNSGIIDDYTVKILNGKISKDYQGKPSLIITVEFANNGDETKNFIDACRLQVFQDSVELSTAIGVDGTDYGSPNKSVKTGGKLNVQEAYLLSNTSSPVEIEISGWLDSSNTKLTKTFDIKSLASASTIVSNTTTEPATTQSTPVIISATDYKEFPGVPDFGIMNNISLLKSLTKNGITVYAYNLTDVKSDYLSKYMTELTNNGFILEKDLMNDTVKAAFVSSKYLITIGYDPSYFYVTVGPILK